MAVRRCHAARLAPIIGNITSSINRKYKRIKMQPDDHRVTAISNNPKTVLKRTCTPLSQSQICPHILLNYIFVECGDQNLVIINVGFYV